MKNSKGKNIFSTVAYSLLMFFVIYNPPIVRGLSFTTIAAVLSAIYLIANFRTLHAVLRVKEIKNLLILFAVFWCYYSFVTVGNLFAPLSDLVLDAYVGTLISYISFFAVTFALVVWSIKSGASYEDVCKIYVIAALIQVVLAIACFASPAIKSFFNGMMMTNSNSDKIRRTVEYFAAYRNYGFASILYDIFGYAMALLGVIALKMALEGKKIYYLVAFAIALTAGVNARSGFVLFLLGFVVIVVAKGGKYSQTRMVRNLFLLAVVGFAVMRLATWIMGNADTEQLMWLATALEETQDMTEGNQTGYYSTLTNDFMIFPDGLELIIGTGLSPAQAIQHNSDVGYIIHLWQYGIIGCILLFSFYAKLFLSAIKRVSWPDSAMHKAFFVMTFVYLVKLTCFGYSMGSVVFGPLCFIAIYQGAMRRQIP